MNDLQHAIAGFETWLTDYAVPFQTSHVRADAGFHERIALDGGPFEMPHRARVTARQLFAFSWLMRLGIAPEACTLLAAHARDFLLDAHLTPEGAIIPLAGGPVAFDLYDVAFVLFALAAAAEAVLPRDTARARAAALRDWLETGWRHPEGGFEEARPRSLPLRSNPHMHIFEASLEWLSTGAHDDDFARIADEIAELCLARFLDPSTGALRELFDGDWQTLDAVHNYVEPGHQYEWGWLMLRWGALRGRADATAAGLRLINLAETHGLNDDSLVSTALHADLSPADLTARLWPQTERIKAWARRAQITTDPSEIVRARDTATVACQGLMRFFDHPLPGSWWENIDSAGNPLSEPARTSSFYHIVGALIELVRLNAFLRRI